MQIIWGRSSPTNSIEQIAAFKGYDIIRTCITNFADGELRVQLSGKISAKVMIVQSLSSPVNDHLVELLFLADAAIRAGAGEIIALIPYLGYSRQDRSVESTALAAQVVIKMIQAAGVTKIITVDIHSPYLFNIAPIPIIDIPATRLFLPVLNKDIRPDIHSNMHPVIVAPDPGGIVRAQRLGSLLNLEVAIIRKNRTDNECYATEILGKVDGRNCILIDDIIDSGRTICSAAELLKKNGAATVTVYATHPVLSDGARDKLQNSLLEKIYISDSILQVGLPDKFQILSIGKLIADNI